MENFQILTRGLTGLCPQCGRGKLFEGWIQLSQECPHCSLQFFSREGDTWAFMYISTAFITGLFILGMLWILPRNLAFGRIFLALGALLFFFLTWPFRKGLAIAIDYFVELRWNNFRGLKFRK